MSLSDLQIKAFRPSERPAKHSDGGGLHLLVSPTGSKLWRVSYRFSGKQKLLSLGPYPTVSLADARARRDAAKSLLKQNIDPSEKSKLDRIASTTSRATTFDAVAEELLSKSGREGKAEATLTKKRWLLGLVQSDIGGRPITEISAAEILVPLRRVEAQGNYETARRLRAVVGQVFRYAIATARAENDPTYGLRGALTAPTVTHRAAFTDWQRFGGLLRAIESYEGSTDTRAALKLLALLYPRPGELRQAEWSEFDLKKRVWTLPAARTKMRREHRKPLSEAAVAILEDVKSRSGLGRLVFPAIHTALRPMSENTLNGALRRMGFDKDEMTSHGFRASASSLLNESGLWHSDAIEAELGHVGADEVRRAYHRAAYWDERVKMTEWWASEVARAEMALLPSVRGVDV
ncbi:tyrosine-type recombinase/integrase [Aurantimonas marianensis]|uniref:Integrase arm-type DNA-binding domain-containing protein n=1 Tax=Aurantimonas marianensis TaxID=2920428 RepID=A0A9X2H5V5_9HYPH|nr:integrase arm-type DNA-binding domain-containing protein [Aurantimonas marianensis]MCP3055852.1 integrase arm-type DNA-binding domain-containing protein [Aurantimonas marianensis]